MASETRKQGWDEVRIKSVTVAMTSHALYAPRQLHLQA
jgi:hypothetical protein